MSEIAPTSQNDILAVARTQVLERGEGLGERQIHECLTLPDDRLEDLLALAHEVRMKWCGPEVEVEGIISVKTGGCPEDCHFCSQSGQFTSPYARRGSTSPRSYGPPRRPPRRAPPSSASSPPYAGRTNG